MRITARFAGSVTVGFYKASKFGGVSQLICQGRGRFGNPVKDDDGNTALDLVPSRLAA